MFDIDFSDADFSVLAFWIKAAYYSFVLFILLTLLEVFLLIFYRRKKVKWAKYVLIVNSITLVVLGLFLLFFMKS